MNEAKVIQAIYCSKETRGKGTELDPIRVIEEILDFDGKLIMEHDSEVKFTKRHLANFVDYIRRSGDITQQLNEHLINGYLQSHGIQ